MDRMEKRKEADGRLTVTVSVRHYKHLQKRIKDFKRERVWMILLVLLLAGVIGIQAAYINKLEKAAHEQASARYTVERTAEV